MVHDTNLQKREGAVGVLAPWHRYGTCKAPWPENDCETQYARPHHFVVLQESLLEAAGHARELRHEQPMLGVTRYLHLDHGRDDFGWFASSVSEAVF